MSKLDKDHMECEECGTVILKGDAHYISGERVCEYCLDRLRDEGAEYDRG